MTPHGAGDGAPVVMITGIGGGLGRALACKFAAEGWRLFLSDLNPGALEAVAGEFRDRGAEVASAAADLRDVSAIAPLVARALDAFPQIDALVNNAGVSCAQSIWDLTPEDWDEVLAVNVKGMFFLLQEVARHMAARGSGSIVNVASVAGRVGRPMLIHYAASKAAVISVTRSAALALAGCGVRVNAVAPGMIDTDMLRRLQSSLEADVEPWMVPSASAIPLGRVADPSDIAEVVLFLASRASAYMTGQTLNVCGGLVLS